MFSYQADRLVLGSGRGKPFQRGIDLAHLVAGGREPGRSFEFLREMSVSWALRRAGVAQVGERDLDEQPVFGQWGGGDAGAVGFGDGRDDRQAEAETVAVAGALAGDLLERAMMCCCSEPPTSTRSCAATRRWQRVRRARPG